MATLTVASLVREITGGMRPHLAHQQAWEQIEGGLHCRACDLQILGVKVFAGAAALPPHARDQVRENVARWIRGHSPDSARLTFKV